MKCHNIVTKNYLLQQYNKHRSYPKTLGIINNRSWGLTQTESGLLQEFVVRVSDDVTSSYSPSTTVFIQIQYSTIEYVILKTPCVFLCDSQTCIDDFSLYFHVLFVLPFGRGGHCMATEVLRVNISSTTELLSGSGDPFADVDPWAHVLGFFLSPNHLSAGVLVHSVGHHVKREW